MAKRDRQRIARRAWSILRVALLWTRKGRLIKRRLMMELRVVPKFLKSLGNPAPRGQISYTREKELSFDKTPVFHVKMYRPTSTRFNIPCISAPQVDFDYEFDEDEETCRGCDYERDFGGRISFLMSQEDDGYDEEIVQEEEEEEEEEEDQEEGIDLRAEEFIAKFYEQMKLQRQNTMRR